MPKQILSLGTLANDGTGDTLRGAGSKIQNNFDELYNGYSSIDSGGYPTGTGTITFDRNTTILNPSAARTWTMPNAPGGLDGTKKRIVNVATIAARKITLNGTFAARGTQVAGISIIPSQSIGTYEWFSGKWYASLNYRDSADT